MKKTVLIKTTVFCLLSVFFTHSSIWATDLCQSVGNFKSVKTIGDGKSYELRAENAIVEITPYTPGMINIHFSKDTIRDRFSYAVVGKPLNEVNFNLKEEKDRLVFTSDSLKLIVRKNPLRFSFFTLNDVLINGDDEGLELHGSGIRFRPIRKCFRESDFLDWERKQEIWIVAETDTKTGIRTHLDTVRVLIRFTRAFLFISVFMIN